MHLLCILLWMLSVAPSVAAPYKTAPPRSGPAWRPAQQDPDALPHGARMLTGELLQVSLLPSGHFTMGTRAGLSGVALDDNCGITYGHPYAHTSYLLVGVDGQWAPARQPPAILPDQVESPQGSNMSLQLSNAGGYQGLEMGCSLELAGDSAVDFIISVSNRDERPVSASVGLVLDPAPGIWSEGVAFVSSQPVEVETTWSGDDVPPTVQMYEQAGAVRGVGADLVFGSTLPSLARVCNWLRAGSTEAYAGELIYDLALRLEWGPFDLDPGRTKLVRFSLGLAPPEFGDGVYMRWDLPSFLTMIDGRMYPRPLNTRVQLTNMSHATLASADVTLEQPRTAESTPAEMSAGLPPGSSMVLSLPLTPRLVYTDQITPYVVTLKRAQGELARVSRALFLPATPVADTGLTVTVDTLDLQQFPKVGARLEVVRDATGLLVTDLLAEHVLLHENGSPITTFTVEKDTSGGATELDLVFVLDVTGSMGGEIAAVRENILEFAESLTQSRLSLRLALVVFGDTVEATYPFTGSPQEFVDYLLEQYPHGGGGREENSLDALFAAAQLNYRPAAQRLAILITDADYHVQNTFTTHSIAAVVDAMLGAGVVVNVIGDQQFKIAFYDPIADPTGGRYYDIDVPFRDILLDISGARDSGAYALSYVSPEPHQDMHQVTVEIRYAGLGGTATASYMPPAGKRISRISCYPNPFNPEVTLLVDSSDYTQGELRVYNALGQLAARMEIAGGLRQRIHWNAAKGVELAAGLYHLQLVLLDDRGNQHRESTRITLIK
jgi:Mg-chelatase subunit ChlD